MASTSVPLVPPTRPLVPIASIGASGSTRATASSSVSDAHTTAGASRRRHAEIVIARLGADDQRRRGEGTQPPRAGDADMHDDGRAVDRDRGRRRGRGLHRADAAAQRAPAARCGQLAFGCRDHENAREIDHRACAPIPPPGAFGERALPLALSFLVTSSRISPRRPCRRRRTSSRCRTGPPVARARAAAWRSASRRCNRADGQARSRPH